MSLDWSQVRHFRSDEFGPPDAAAPDPELVERLEAARDQAGIPFVITSGIRTPERNAAVGGAADSAHVTGHGVDIACAGSRARYRILRAVIDAGFHRIGVYDKHIHVDTSPSHDPRVIWVGKSK